MEQSHIHSKPAVNTEKNVYDIFARIISDIANPLLIPVWVVLATGLIMDIPSLRLGLITVIAGIFFTLIPFGVVIYQLKNGKIGSLDVPDRKNRSRLFVYSIMSTTVGSLLIFLLSFSNYQFLATVSVVFLLNPIIAYFLNLVYKISIHTAAVSTAGILFIMLQGSVAGIGIPVLGFSLFMLLVLLPLMFWARYRLGIHTIPELVWGSTAGIVLTLVISGVMQTIL